MRAQCPHFFDFGHAKGGTRVALSHRTVLDFLAKDEVLGRLQSRLPHGKHPRLALIMSRIADVFSSGARIDFLIYGVDRALVRLVEDLEPQLIKNCFKQVQQVVIDTPPWMRPSSQSINGPMYPTTSGWVYGNYCQYIKDVFEFDDPTAHVMATHHSSTLDLFDIVQKLNVPEAERELILIRRWFNGENRQGLPPLPSCNDIDAENLGRLFPHGVPRKSLGLQACFQWLLRQRRLTVERKFASYPQEYILRMLETVLPLMQLFIEHGAALEGLSLDPSSVEEATTPISYLRSLLVHLEGGYYVALESMREVRERKAKRHPPPPPPSAIREELSSIIALLEESETREQSHIPSD